MKEGVSSLNHNMKDCPPETPAWYEINFHCVKALIIWGLFVTSTSGTLSNAQDYLGGARKQIKDS